MKSRASFARSSSGVDAEGAATAPASVTATAILSAPGTIETCQEVLGHTFKNPGLLRAALTHSSGAEHPLASNERLEFLGDAILGMIICEELYRRLPNAREGELTRIKSHVVSRSTCAEASRRLGLENFLVLGKGMGHHSLVPSSTLANVFESLVGALHLDGGLETARAFVLRHLGGEIERAESEAVGDNYKSQLQQLAQRQHNSTPVYQLLDEKGPDHQKCFKIAARIGNRPAFTPAWGNNKKDAEQRAARNALSELRGEPAPHPAD